MPFGTRDGHVGIGMLTDSITMPTHLISCNLCTWVVIRCASSRGPAISQLKYSSAMCSRCSQGRGKLDLAVA